jgi:fatty-acyl-CoA synthase
MSRALSYAHGAAAEPLLAETVSGALDRVVAAYADRPAVVSCAQGLRYSYRELREEVGRAARGLRAIGINPTDRVALWTANRAEAVVAIYAVATVGAVLVNLNPAYTIAEAAGALEHSGSSALLVSIQASRRGSVTQLAAALRDRGMVPRCGIVDIDGREEMETVSWADLLRRGNSSEAVGAAAQFDDCASIMYTSGTTGLPKGATLAHYSLVNSGRLIGDRLGYSADDRVCVPVPLYHTFGYVLGALAAMTHGAALVLPAPTFDAAACLDAVEAERCTSLLGVPAMFAAILAHRAFEHGRVTSLRTGITAGAPCPPALMRDVMTTLHMPEVTICYGMTEAGTLCQSVPADPADTRAGTVGAVHAHVECKIVDPETSRTVPRGQPGELWGRGYCLMSGYWENEAATRAMLDAGGWIRTGDMATMRDDGYVAIVGRLKDIVISGGQNIYPAEVEDVLRAHPLVVDAAVVGVPDEVYGEAGCAWIQLRDGETLTADEVRRFCRDRLAAFKVPRRVQFTAELPRTATGKIQKYKLRQLPPAATVAHAEGT